MRKIIFILVPLFLINFSCATIINSRTQRIDIITNKEAEVGINGEVLANAENRTKIVALRDVRPVEISVFNDTMSKHLVIDSRTSIAYWLNLYPSLGLGMLIDKDTPKRFAYPKKVYVDMTNSTNSYYIYNPGIRKGTLYFNSSFPWVNSFLLKPLEENSTKSHTGFMGIMVSLDYYYKTNRYVNLSFSGVTDFIFLFPAPVDFDGEVDFMSSLYASFSSNYRIKRFTAGYGVSFSKNIWDHRYYQWQDSPPPVRDPVTKIDYSLGFIFPLYCEIGEYFKIGLLYRPSFMTISPVTKFKYEHLISMDFAWKIPLIR
jgi:hypothetical protein